MKKSFTKNQRKLYDMLSKFSDDYLLGQYDSYLEQQDFIEDNIEVLRELCLDRHIIKKM